MEKMEVDALPTRIYDFLYRLGLNANIFGFQYLSGAIFLSIRNPERFGIFTEEIYAELSRLYRVEPDDVRRAVRRALFLIWKNNPALDGETRSNPLSPEQFLAYARQYFAAQEPERKGDKALEIASGETPEKSKPAGSENNPS